MKIDSIPELSLAHKHKDIIDRLMQLKKPGTRPEFIVGGGAALAILGIRDSHHDIDAYCAKPKQLDLSGQHEGLEVDITNSLYFWGQINLGDALKNSPVLIDNSEIKIQYLSADAMFIHKADAAREKDIADVAVLSNYLDIASILNRMAALKAYNSYDIWYLAAENLLAEIQCQYGQAITFDMIEMLDLETDDAYVLSRTFGVLQQQTEYKQYAAGVKL